MPIVFRLHLKALLVALGFATLLCAPALVAQARESDAPTTDPPASADTDKGELTAAGAPVSVGRVPPDARISKRLQEILRATGLSADVEVEIDAGVAILRGEVEDETTRKWLAALASNTEGIAAVWNRLKIREAPLWSWRPALEELRELWRGVVSALPRIAAGLLFLAAFALLASRLAAWITTRLHRRLSSELLSSVLRKLITLIVWLVGLYLFLRISGLTRIAVTVIGGTGVLGVVLGFAFRDIAENFLASILISLQKPFRYGDTIEVEGQQGIVQRVTPRGTVLMDYDGNYIQMANATVYKSTIKNFTANPLQRTLFSVGIGYDARVSYAQGVVMEALRAHPAVVSEPTPLVLVDRLASATIELHVYFWIDGTRHSLKKVRSAVMRRVVASLLDAGVSMPDDAREVVFPDGVPIQHLQGHEVENDIWAQVQAPSPSARGAESADAHGDESEATDAEDDLSSDTEELNDQARRSRQPEEGEDVLSS